MSGLAPAIDFTARDFDSLLNATLALFKQRIGAFRYNDAVASGVAPGVLAVLSWFQEQNAFYYNRRQINGLLMLADTREAMSLLTLAQGYRMRPATSASVSVQAQPNPPQPVPITLTKGTRITVGNLIFEVATDAVIPPGVTFWPDGTTSDLIVLTEGATITETFTSDGSQFQTFQLGQPGTIDGSVQVSILGEVWQEVSSLVFIEGSQRGRDTFKATGGDSQQYKLSLLNAIIDPNDEDHLVLLVTPPGGTNASVQTWIQVDDFTGAPHEFTLSQDVNGVTTITFGLAADGSAPAINSTIDTFYLIVGAQKRYQLIYDSDDRGTIQFGDGVFGIIPQNGATITVTYRVGGGIAGNVGVGVINTSVNGMLPNGASTPVTIVNLEAGSGGQDPESVDHARFFAPKFAISNTRAVTRQDFTVLAATYIDPLYGSPAHANAFLKQSIPELNTVEVAVWGRDHLGQLTTAGTPLKVGIKNFLDSRRTITTVVELIDGTVLLLDIEANIVLQTGQDRQTVFSAINSAIQTFFLSSNILPGVDVSIGQLYATIQDVPGVQSAEITKITGSVIANLVLGTGDGATKLFGGLFLLPEGATLVGNSVSVTDGSQQVVDNGAGVFTGNIDGSVTPGALGDSVNYLTGAFSVQFANAPAAGSSVTAQAKITFIFPKTEDLGASNGTVASIAGATEFYPIVLRAPRGVWSGDPHQVINAFRVGTTAEFRGTLPTGITPSTLTVFEPNTGQTVTDNGAGTLLTPTFSMTLTSPAGFNPGDKVNNGTGYASGIVQSVVGSLLTILVTGGTWPASGSITDATTSTTTTYTGGAASAEVVGTVSYTQGTIDFTFAVNPPLSLAFNVKAVWHTTTMDFFAPPDYLPLTPGRVYIWGGYGADGAETPAEIVAYDDGQGNIAGNVLPGGTIDYDTGHIVFTWNTTPPPGPGAGNEYVARLQQVPDGVRRTFDFSFGTNISRFAASNLDRGEGRTRFAFSDLATPGFLVQDGWDNHQGVINGPSVDVHGQDPLHAGVSVYGYNPNTIDYTNGRGRVTFANPLPAPPTAPASAPSGAVSAGGAVTVGTHQYVITNVVAGAGESLAGPASAVVTTTPGNQTVTLSSIPLGPVGTLARIIYRTLAGAPGVYFLVAIILDNVTTSFVDIIADTSIQANKQPPPSFFLRITNVGNMLYSGWVFFVKTPAAPGLDKGLFADNTGRFYGPPGGGSSNPFPFDRLDAIRGVYQAGLQGSPIAAGREMQLTYDALTGVPPALDITIPGDVVAAPGRIALTEQNSTLFANG